MSVSTRAEERRRNLIRADQIPFRMVEGGTIDSGEMPELMERQLRRADYVWLRVAPVRSERRGNALVCSASSGMYLEQCGGGTSAVSMCGSVKTERSSSSLAARENGQGHRTTLTQILSDPLGFDADLIRRARVRRGPPGTTGGARTRRSWDRPSPRWRP